MSKNTEKLCHRPAKIYFPFHDLHGISSGRDLRGLSGLNLSLRQMTRGHNNTDKAHDRHTSQRGRVDTDYLHSAKYVASESGS